MLEAFCLFIIYLGTITSDDFSISTFVILTLCNVHDYFALHMVNTLRMLLFCTYSHIYWYAYLVGYVAYCTYNAWNLMSYVQRESIQIGSVGEIHTTRGCFGSCMFA